ncbi:5-hydroxytryptamine receptor 3A-like isoform X1 [Apis dorsata]|uniref:5-hydroxytryptamine receptor 3A-like isoform X1 n=1 Tax=Apis dorsata TaxID=7462 RepID=UPI0003DF4B3C|nr:5-hydroxytryptamine receptor 3A-like isoform X1 [Apis dorsata]
MKNIFPVLFVIINVLLHGQVICYICKDITSTSALHRLKQYLFCDYDREVIPEEKNGTKIDFGLSIQHYNVDEYSHTVDFHVLLKLMWKQNHFTWKSSEFDSINSIRVKSYEIWVPDIVMHSVTSVGVDLEMPSVECIVFNSGTILCVPFTTYTPVCEFDHSWWPYDILNCTIHIASWSHGSNEIKLNSLDTEERILDDMYNNNTEWEIVHMSHTERTIDSKFGLGFTTDLLSYNILLRRHYSMNSTTYVTLITVLMTMTLMTLWLEPSSTERMIIANLNFILHLFCLLDVQWRIPFNGIQIPNLMLFYEKSLALAAFSLILTSILRYLQELHADAPTWISSITESVLKSKVGQVFLITILDSKVSARIEMNEDDNTSLVSLDRKQYTWRYTSILIGWSAFLCISFAYIIMLIIFIPRNKYESFKS